MSSREVIKQKDEGSVTALSSACRSSGISFVQKCIEWVLKKKLERKRNENRAANSRLSFRERTPPERDAPGPTARPAFTW